jgi:small subunit ribosomal protein S16
MGAKKRPFYRIVVTDSRNARDGRFIENIGYYDPTIEPPVLKVDVEKAQEWIGKGAQPSDTCRGLLKKMGMLGGQSEASIARAAAKIEAKKRGKVKVEAPAIVEEKAAPAEEVAVEEAPVEEAAANIEAKKHGKAKAEAPAIVEENAAPAEEAAVEEAPVEEAAAEVAAEVVVEEAPAEEPVAEETPAEEPAAEAEAAEEAKPEEAAE